MASVRSPTSSARSSLVTGSMATHTQRGERARRWRASGLADLPGLDGTQQGVEFVQLDLGDAHVVQKMLREGLEMVGGLDQPRQHRVGIDLEHAGHGTDAQPFRQRAHRPHQQVGGDALAIQRRAVRLQEIALAGGAVPLAPGAAVGMAVGLEIAVPHPAIIGTVRMGAELGGGVDLSAGSPGGR